MRCTDEDPNLRFFLINFGPWDRLDEDEAFYEAEKVGEKPKGANYYPEDMTKQEFEEWLATLDQTQQENAKGFYHVIKRQEGGLVAVPYSEEYKEWLQPAAKLLKEAADLVEDPSLKLFLSLRADAFLSDDYFDSDAAWLDVSSDCNLDITVGPYEVYEDELFNYKAAFVAYITVRDLEESEKLKKFAGWMQQLEDNLPVPDLYKNPNIGTTTPIAVVNVLYLGGDRAGPQTAAFNLPNDNKVIEKKGSKLVILKNIQEEKFEKILKPISEVVIDQEQLKYVQFNSFFTHILAHEMCHSLGPHNVLNHKDQDSLPENHGVRQLLQELHSAIEEAKADITGLWALQYLIDNQKISFDEETEKSFYVTFLAGSFRSIRFGLKEAHGKGQALQLSYLLDNEGVIYNEETEKFSVNFSTVADVVKNLVAEILVIQGNGDKEEAQKMLNKYGVLKEEVGKALEKLEYCDIPVDIEPLFTFS